MSSTPYTPPKTVSTPRDEEDLHPYRTVSKAAVVSLSLAVFSLPAIVFPGLLFLPLVAAVLGLVGYVNIRRWPEELSGRKIAAAGLILSLLIVAGGAGIHTAIYLTEVPEGYQRVSFSELQPEEYSRLPVPRRAMQLDGKKVFIKGYIHPDVQKENIKRFVLVPDMGTCCFGGQPKLTDMVEVTLRDPLRTEYSRRKRKLAGVLKVDTDLKPVSGLNGVYYQLEADYVK